ncbi:MAG: GGDEF domain-containing protein [Bacillota bacterium]
MKTHKHKVIENLIHTTNLNRLKVIYLLFFAVEALFLFYVERIRLLSASGERYDLVLTSYLLHLFLAVVTIAFAITFHLMKHRSKNETLVNNLPLLSMFLVLTTSGVISLFYQLSDTATILFTAHLIILGLLIFVRPYWNIPLYGIPFFIFLVGTLFFQEDTALMTTQLINGGVALGGVLFASKAFYEHKVYTLHYRITLKETNRKLEKLSTLDPLTHLPNRRYFEDQVNYEVAISRRYQLSASFLMIDIDHFKAINDTYGHEAGDKVLVELSSILRQNVRDSDTVSRYGGEEFMLLLSHTDINGADILANRLRAIVETHTFNKDETPISITISIGVAPLLHNLEDPYKTTYRLVDEALYKAKKNGRNQVITLKRPSMEEGV